MHVCTLRDTVISHTGPRLYIAGHCHQPYRSPSVHCGTLSSVIQVHVCTLRDTVISHTAVTGRQADSVINTKQRNRCTSVPCGTLSSVRYHDQSQEELSWTVVSRTYTTFLLVTRNREVQLTSSQTCKNSLNLVCISPSLI